MFNFKKSIVAVMSALAISVTGIASTAFAAENISNLNRNSCHYIDDCNIDNADISSENEYSASSTYPFPYSEYKGGTYYTENGSKCTDHGHVGKDGAYVNPCKPGIACNCKEFEWSIQCAGFAREIYSKYHGYSMDSATKNQLNKSITTADDAKNIILGLPECTFIKVQTASGIDHFMIVTRTSENYVTLYHANYKDGCEITYERILYSEFKNRFSYIYYTC